MSGFNIKQSVPWLVDAVGKVIGHLRADGTEEFLSRVLAQSAVPYGIANSGTLATNGTYTAGTAYGTTYSGGIWLYFPATAFATLPAGFYWCVGSSTTGFQVYTSQTSNVLVTGSNSAFTGDTTQRTAVTITLPGGTMGSNGSFKAFIGGTVNSTAGTKTAAINLGASNLATSAVTTTTNYGLNIKVTNKGLASLQRISNIVSSNTATGGFSSIDTSVDQSITLKLTLGVATDVLVIEDYAIELLYTP